MTAHRDPDHSRRPRSVLSDWVHSGLGLTILGGVMAAILSGVILLVVEYRIFADNPTPPISEGPQGSPGPPQTAIDKPLAIIPNNFFDDFSINSLDASRWEPTLDSNYIFVQDQALQIRVASGQAADSVTGLLIPKIGNQPIKEVAFIMTLISYSGNTAGGAKVNVVHAGGRDHTVRMGPSPKGYPEIEYDLCLKEQCNQDYHDYAHKSIRIGVGQPVRMRIVWTGEKIQFFVDGELQVEGPADITPITNVEFGFEADPGSVYHAKVDDVAIIHV